MQKKRTVPYFPELVPWAKPDCSVKELWEFQHQVGGYSRGGCSRGGYSISKLFKDAKAERLLHHCMLHVVSAGGHAV